MEVWITFVVQQVQFNRFHKIVILHQPPYTFKKCSGRLSRPVGDLQLTQMNKRKQEHHHRKVKGRAVYTKT